MQVGFKSEEILSPHLIEFNLISTSAVHKMTEVAAC